MSDDVPNRPRSRFLAAVRRFFSWSLQWVLWDDRPTAAAFRLACLDRDRAEARVRDLERQLHAAYAEADAGRAEVAVLAAVVKRNEERVLAEAARASADRERAISQAGDARAARQNE